ncbi:MAG: Lipopolysaccharide export system permease protein LptG [Hyphomicrobiaceae bacterium hypho_1]
MIIKFYIARKFCLMVSITFLVCASLIFMIDFVELLRESGKKGNVSLVLLIQLVMLRVPAYTEIFLTFAVLVGSLASLLIFARRSELAVMRAGGISVWGVLAPCTLIAFILGLFSTTLYNTLAANSRALAEEKYALVFGKSSNFLKQTSGLPWLRQDGIDGPSIISAKAVTEKGLRLLKVNVYQYNENYEFVESINAKTAKLFDGYWLLEDGLIIRPGNPSVPFKDYIVSSYLSPAKVRDALGSVISLSFWELPKLIESVEQTGLPTTAYRVQYQLLLARPFLLVAMVLLAATVSLKSFRSGGTQIMVVYGLTGGICFFLLAEISRQFGASGIIAPWVAVWVPILSTCLIASAILLHQEDG